MAKMKLDILDKVGKDKEVLLKIDCNITDNEETMFLDIHKGIYKEYLKVIHKDTELGFDIKELDTYVFLNEVKGFNVSKEVTEKVKTKLKELKEAKVKLETKRSILKAKLDILEKIHFHTKEINY